MRKSYFLIGCLLFSLCSFAQTRAPSKKIRMNNIRKAEAACGGPAIKFLVQANPITGVLPPVVAGQARIVIFEYMGNSFMPVKDLKRHYLFGPTIRIGLDGKWIGATKGRSYIAFSVAPGEHHLCAQWQPGHGDPSGTIALAPVEVTAGKTYMRTVSFRPGAFYSVLDLLPVDLDEENLLLHTSVPVVFTINNQNAIPASGNAKGNGGSQ